MPATLFQRTMPCNASPLLSSGFLTRSIRFPVLPSIGFRTGRLVFGTRSWRTNRLRYPSSALKRSPSTSMRYESHLPLLSCSLLNHLSCSRFRATRECLRCPSLCRMSSAYTIPTFARTTSGSTPRRDVSAPQTPNTQMCSRSPSRSMGSSISAVPSPPPAAVNLVISCQILQIR